MAPPLPEARPASCLARKANVRQRVRHRHDAAGAEIGIGLAEIDIFLDGQRRRQRLGEFLELRELSVALPLPTFLPAMSAGPVIEASPFFFRIATVASAIGEEKRGSAPCAPW